MNPISICLLLPVACILALPSQYSYYTKDGNQQELSNEFWSQHFGPDFQHAVHFQLEQSHLIDNGNAIGRNQTENNSGHNSGNRKRSTYILHKSQNNNEHLHEDMGNSMRVHLLQPHEMEALEREMLSYARGNGMMQSPVVVNLPESEGSLSRNPGQENPMVLNIPPVVYHSGANSPNQRYADIAPYTQHSYSQGSSLYDQIQIPYQTVPSSYMNIQSPYEAEVIQKPSPEVITPPENEPKVPSYKETQKTLDDAIQPSREESKPQDEPESQDKSKAERE